MAFDAESAAGALHHRVAVDLILAAADVDATGKVKTAGLIGLFF